MTNIQPVSRQVWKIDTVTVQHILTGNIFVNKKRKLKEYEDRRVFRKAYPNLELWSAYMKQKRNSSIHTPHEKLKCIFIHKEKRKCSVWLLRGTILKYFSYYDFACKDLLGRK